MLTSLPNEASTNTEFHFGIIQGGTYSLVRKIGKISSATAQAVFAVLVEMFSRATLAKP